MWWVSFPHLDDIGWRAWSSSSRPVSRDVCAVMFWCNTLVGSVTHHTNTQCCTFWCYTLLAVLHWCLAGGGGGGVCGRHDHHSGQGAGSGRQRRWTFVILCCGQPAAILIYWTPATTLSRLYLGHIQNQKANWDFLIYWYHEDTLENLPRDLRFARTVGTCSHVKLSLQHIIVLENNS